MQSAFAPTMVQQCIDDCLHCYRTCLQTAMNHCLVTGGRHTEPEHFRLMTNCAELCRTTAEFIMSSSSMHAHVCQACEQVCRSCADSCEQIGDMDECVQACRACMESCRQMASVEELGHMPDHLARGGDSLQERLPMQEWR